MREKEGKRYSWRKWTALAVGLVLVIGGIGLGMYRGTLQSSSGDALQKVVFPKACAFDDYDARYAVRQANPLTDEFLNAVDEFTCRTAAEFLRDSDTNINYSPLSLYYALSLAAAGAEGETAGELFALLGVSGGAQLSEQCGNMYRQLYADNKIGKLKIANSLWLNDSLSFKEGYVANAAENFYASSYHVNFADSSTAKIMSQWIADNTNGTLQPEFRFNNEHLMTILNTVYFKDEWTDRFQKSETEKDTFYLADGGTVECDFMNRTVSSGGFVKGEGFISASLGLKNAGSMTFILPDEGVTPQELLAEPKKAQEVLGAEVNVCGRIIWQVPKFEFGSTLDAAEGLQRLGVQEAFRETADFSGITDGMAYISNVRQETHIAIDEEGVEASAFTSIAYAGAAMPTDTAEMILNRPFIYVITSNNGTVLFIGICENPV